MLRITFFRTCNCKVLKSGKNSHFSHDDFIKTSFQVFVDIGYGLIKKTLSANFFVIADNYNLISAYTFSMKKVKLRSIYTHCSTGLAFNTISHTCMINKFVIDSIDSIDASQN